jgi:hypothetical protein
MEELMLGKRNVWLFQGGFKAGKKPDQLIGNPDAERIPWQSMHRKEKAGESSKIHQPF